MHHASHRHINLLISLHLIAHLNFVADKQYFVRGLRVLAFILFINLYIWAFKGDTTIGIVPTSFSGIMTFCDNGCFQKPKKVLHSLDLFINKNKIIIRIYLIYQIILTTYNFLHLHI